jgi:hypothetical protein
MSEEASDMETRVTIYAENDHLTVEERVAQYVYAGQRLARLPPRIDGVTQDQMKKLDAEHLLGVRFLDSRRSQCVVFGFRILLVRAAKRQPPRPTEVHIAALTDGNVEYFSRADVLRGAHAWVESEFNAKPVMLRQLWSDKAFLLNAPKIEYAKNSEWFAHAKPSFMRALRDAHEDGFLQEFVTLINSVGSSLFKPKKDDDDENAIINLLRAFATERRRAAVLTLPAIGEPYTLSNVILRLKNACETIPLRLNMNALRDYAGDAGTEYAKVAFDDDAVVSDDDSGSDEAVAPQNDAVPFEGVFPSALTLGMNRVKTPIGGVRDALFQTIRTFRMLSDGTGVEWTLAFDGPAADPKSVKGSSVRKATVPPSWSEPEGARATDDEMVGVSREQAVALRQEGGAREIMHALAGNSTANFLSYLKESGMANGAQLASTYSFVGVLVHGRLAFRAIWGNQDAGMDLFERLVNPADDRLAFERADTMYVPFSTRVEEDTQNALLPVTYDAGDARYKVGSPFAAMFSDALGADAVGLVAREYVDNVFKTPEDVYVHVEVEVRDERVLIRLRYEAEEKRSVLWAEDLLPSLYPDEPDELELRIISVEFPVYNPFVAAGDGRGRARVLETRADFIGAVRRKGDATQTLVGLIMGEYKTLMELNTPVGRVCADDHVSQTLTNALLLLMCSGLRVDYGLILYSTKRYPNESDNVPRGYAAAIDMRFENASQEVRDAVRTFALKVSYAPFHENEVSVYADGTYDGVIESWRQNPKVKKKRVPHTELGRIIDVFVDGTPLRPDVESRNDPKGDEYALFETLEKNGAELWPDERGGILVDRRGMAVPRVRAAFAECFSNRAVRTYADPSLARRPTSADVANDKTKDARRALMRTVENAADRLLDLVPTKTQAELRAAIERMEEMAHAETGVQTRSMTASLTPREELARAIQILINVCVRGSFRAPDRNRHTYSEHFARCSQRSNWNIDVLQATTSIVALVEERLRSALAA